MKEKYLLLLGLEKNRKFFLKHYKNQKMINKSSNLIKYIIIYNSNIYCNFFEIYNEDTYLQML